MELSDENYASHLANRIVWAINDKTPLIVNSSDAARLRAIAARLEPVSVEERLPEKTLQTICWALEVAQENTDSAEMIAECMEAEQVVDKYRFPSDRPS